MATIIGLFLWGSGAPNSREFATGARGQLVALQRAHDVDDALVDVDELDVGQRARIMSADIFEDDALAVRFVDRQIGCALQAADFLGRCGALAD
jgi:hypothetical protein